MSSDLVWSIRAAEPGDMDFVGSTWRRSYDRAEYARAPSLLTYIASQRAAIDRALAAATVDVAYSVEHPEVILGWVAHAERAVLHYLYVKDRYRRLGIGQALLEHALGSDTREVFCSHHWRGLPVASVLAAKAQERGVRLHFNPALIFG